METTAGGPVIEASGLSFGYDRKKVLDVPSLALAPHEVLGIIGPNGSGKTTLSLCLALLLKPASGVVRFNGSPMTDDGSRLRARRHFAVVFQEPLLLDSSVADNVLLGLRLRRVKSKDARRRAAEWLDRFGIAGLAGRQARTLSGGEAQRASLARAFALEPSVMFLDEPFSNLDAPMREGLLPDLQTVLRETRTSAIVVTHDRNEALALADRIAVLIDGRIRQAGTAAEVFSSPASEEVAAFVGVENVLRGVVTGQHEGVASVALDGGHALHAVSPLPAGTGGSFCIRPEDITITIPAAQAEASSALNRVGGRVVAVFPTGPQVRVTIDCGFRLVALITRRSCQEMGIEPGKQVVASFKASSAHLIPRR